MSAVSTASATRPRGQLRVYLGAAPGVGKTFAMLDEAQRRKARGTDVVIGYVETHDRPRTAALTEGLETLPRRTLTHRGATFTELDVEAVLRRRPEVVLVDELAHTNVTGSRHEKRWQDVQEILDAGIDVVTTVNIQHLESVNDVVATITGVVQHETVPDAVVRAAAQIELRDMTAEALRRRLAHGNVYAPEKVDAALANYFRPGNLNALRELALLWTADRVDDALQRYREQHQITRTWETRERVVVALTGGPEGETLIRRAARIAARSGSGDLLAVHVVRSDGLAGANQEVLADQRRLVESLGGTYHQVLGDDVPGALLSFARAENATQLVLGDSRRTRLQALLSGPGVSRPTIRSSGDIDVHIVTHALSAGGTVHPRALPRRRRIVAAALAVVLPVLLTVALVPLRSHVNLVSDMLLFLLVTVACSVAGGIIAAVVAAVLASVLLNYYFTPPLHTLTIRETNNALALFVFVAVAIVVSSALDLAARRTRDAARSAAESRTLADLAETALSEADVVHTMLQRLRETFSLESVTLFERETESSPWTVVSAAGNPLPGPDAASSVVPADTNLVLGLDGTLLRADDQRLIGAFASQVAVAREHERLSEEAAAAGPLAEADKMRTALLAAVGHDLRTPLAAAKASVSSLLSSEVRLGEDDRHELLVAADESLDRLTALIANLLDMSRLQAEAMPVELQPTPLDDVVAQALAHLGDDSLRVLVDIPEDLPPLRADPGLLERVVANLVGNAVRHSPQEHPPLIAASHLRDRVEIRVVDRGPGIPPETREQVFVPFQRLGDTDNSTGIGLGLALSRGLTEAMEGSLEPEETPGGGLTMVVSLRTDAPPGPTEPGLRERNDEGAEQ